MAFNREQKIINALKSRPEIKTPIATDMFIPNHSGVSTHPEFKNYLDDNYVKVAGDTMTGDLTIQTDLYVTDDITCDGLFPHFVWFEDDEICYFGDSFQSQIYFDGNDLYLYNSGTTKDIAFKFGNNKTILCDGSAGLLNMNGVDMKAAGIGLDGSNPSGSYALYKSGTTSLPYMIYIANTYQGSASGVGATNFVVTNQSTATSNSTYGFYGGARLDANPSGTAYVYGARIEAGKLATRAITQGTHNYYGAYIFPYANTTAGNHTNATVNQYGIFVDDDNWVKTSGTYNYYAVWIEGDEGIYFRDTALYINSDDDGHPDLHADTSIDLNGTVSATGNMDVVGDFTAGTIQADNGYNGTFLDGAGNTVHVTGGIITDITC